MLVVNVEIHPFGNQTWAKTVSRIEIGNDASGNLDVGHYDVWHDGEHVGRIEDYQRKFGATELAAKALVLVTEARSKDHGPKRSVGRRK